MAPVPTETFQIWHGSRRWDGEPEIRPAKKGRAEWGAGIYGSTHFETCTGYAKGGGKVQLLTIQKTRVLEQSCIPLETAIAFIKKSIPKSQVRSFIDDCTAFAERVQDRILSHSSPVGELKDGDLWFPAENLRNLMVNSDLSSGVRGVALAKFYADLGIGLSTSRGGMKSEEQWTVIYDPKLIVSWKAHTYESALEVGHVLPEPDAHTVEPVVYQRSSRRTPSFSMDY